MAKPRKRVRRSSGRPWSAGDDEVLREGLAAGKRPSDLAERLGRTVRAVENRTTALRLPPRKPRWTPEDDKRLAELWDEPIDIGEVADMLGRTISAVVTRARRLELPRRAYRPDRPRARPWTDDEEDMLRDAWNVETVSDLGQKLGRSPQSIRAKARLLGLDGERKSQVLEELRMSTLKPIEVVALVNELLTLGETVDSIRSEGVHVRSLEWTPEMRTVARHAHLANGFRPEAWTFVGLAEGP